MSCSNVTSPCCDAPANLQGVKKPRTSCFACGEAVCKSCSRIMRWYTFGRRRVCDRCRDDHERSGE